MQPPIRNAVLVVAVLHQGNVLLAQLTRVDRWHNAVAAGMADGLKRGVRKPLDHLLPLPARGGYRGVSLPQVICRFGSTDLELQVYLRFQRGARRIQANSPNLMADDPVLRIARQGLRR